MKILLDPVYTQRPSACSTSYLAWEIIERLIEWRDDVFFYLIYPPQNLDEDQHEFLARYPDRVKLVPLVQSVSDRVSECFMLRNDLRYILNPWSIETWDADVVISSRMPVLKHMRTHSSRCMGSKTPSLRAYVGLEEMPFLPFRDTVPWGEFMLGDTLMTYALTDLTLVSGQWLKKTLRPYMREVLTPAWQKKVNDRVIEALPVKIKRLNLKSNDELYKDGTFNLTFMGRITSTRNFDGVASLFRKQFSYPLGKGKQDMQMSISTNSSGGNTGKDDLEFVDVQQNSRKQFYEFLETAHVALNLSPVEDFSLTTYETLLHGVPLIVYDHPWNGFLGADYPFRAKSELEAYAFINAFASDYEAMYQKFRDWEASHWKQYVEGPLNLTTSEALITFLEGFEVKRREYTANVGASLLKDVRSMETTVVDGKEVLSFNPSMLANDTIRERKAEHSSSALGRSATTLMWKLKAEEDGWKDTNEVGVMTR